MSNLWHLSHRKEVSLLIAFLDLTRYQSNSQKFSDREIANTLDSFYQKITEPVVKAGGKVVKFMGDASLLVFPETLVDEGVIVLLSLKEEIDPWLEKIGWNSRLMIKIHFGSVIAGPYGQFQQFDVIGKEVNVTATLETPGLALSTQAFRKLQKETRTLFKKHTPPITYIRQKDRHRMVG